LAVFGDYADEYDKFRPYYPSFLFDDACKNLSKKSALDVCCGTGRGALELKSRGFECVIAVDADKGMLRNIKKTEDNIVTLQSSAEEMTAVADDSINLIVCLQAFHWLDPEKALTEFRRVLAGDGKILIAWNVSTLHSPLSPLPSPFYPLHSPLSTLHIFLSFALLTCQPLTTTHHSNHQQQTHQDRNLDDPFIEKWEGLIEKHNPKYHRSIKLAGSYENSMKCLPGLGITKRVYANPQLVSADDFIAQMLTFSYVRNALSPDALNAIEDETRELISKTYGVQGSVGKFELQWSTKAYELNRNRSVVN